jgi:outer membrane protein OmpA-like peptidoglycan-associated protein
MVLSRWAVVLSLLATGCAHVGERVVLLPSADGHASAVVVTTAQGKTVLDAPYAEVELKDGTLTRSTLAKDEVHERYGSVLDARPPRPHSYTIYFYFETAVLKPESMAMVDRIKAELKTMQAAEIVVIGHTDSSGPIAFNDELSMQRAVTVRDAFIAIGVPQRSISIAGRGEREPAVPTADGVFEPRNRRVEIKIR